MKRMLFIGLIAFIGYISIVSTYFSGRSNSLILERTSIFWELLDAIRSHDKDKEIKLQAMYDSIDPKLERNKKQWNMFLFGLPERFKQRVL